jgi:hypothetical protein
MSLQEGEYTQYVLAGERPVPLRQCKHDEALSFAE